MHQALFVWFLASVGLLSRGIDIYEQVNVFATFCGWNRKGPSSLRLNFKYISAKANKTVSEKEQPLARCKKCYTLVGTRWSTQCLGSHLGLGCYLVFFVFQLLLQLKTGESKRLRLGPAQVLTWKPKLRTTTRQQGHLGPSQGVQAEFQNSGLSLNIKKYWAKNDEIVKENNPLCLCRGNNQQKI